MADWQVSGLIDDVRPFLFAALRNAQSCALATIAAADGGPRPVGSQMVITETECWGFLSGGCIEADVALHGRQVITNKEPRYLVYGRGSPFIDVRLPCGGRIEVLVEAIAADDPAVVALEQFGKDRMPAYWTSDGRHRQCRPEKSEPPPADSVVEHCYQPMQRLAVIGTDPFALAIAAIGQQMGWETVLIAPSGPSRSVPFQLRVIRSNVVDALRSLAPDAWTAVAIATHDLDLDHEAILAAIDSEAGYIGVLGFRRRLPERLKALKSAGASDVELSRLHAPIGLPIRAGSPWEVAVAVAGQIIASGREPENVWTPAAADCPSR